MPLYCPLFPTAEADGTRTCLRCGATCPPDPAALRPSQAAESATAPPGSRFDASGHLPFLPIHTGSWKMPTLAAGVLLALIGVALLFASHPPHSRVAARPAAGQNRGTAVPPPKARAATLAVRLVSSEKNSHVRVGSRLTLTAFTLRSQARSVKLALFYQQEAGPRTLLSFAQGSLCSAAWTALSPGRYTFLASAGDDHRQTALSPRLEITVDTARSPLAAAPPARPTGVARSQRRLPAALPLPPAPPSAQFHVVAARFPRSGNAAILANALQTNGLHAKVRRMASRRWGIGYVVETGSYSDKEEAQRQSLALQRSGYPAYYFGKP